MLIKAVGVICSFLLCFSYAVHAEVINVVTEDAYPLQYVEKGEVAGPVTAIVKAVLDDAGYEYKVALKPWARAYQEALDNENTLIYSMARTKEREDKFKWVGSIMEINYYLVGLKTLNLPESTSLSSLKHLPVGAIRNSATHHYLVEQGFDNIYLVSHPKQSINMLKLGRIKLFPTNYESFQLSCLSFKVDCTDITPVIKLEKPSSSLYFALSVKTDDVVVEKVRASYQKVMKKSATNLLSIQHH